MIENCNKLGYTETQISGQDANAPSPRIRGNVAVIYKSQDDEDKMITACCSVGMTAQGQEMECAEELQRMEEIAELDEESREYLRSMKGNVNGKGQLYMSVFRDQAAVSGDAVEKSLPGLAHTIIAVFGGGNYVFDTTGSFYLPNAISDESYEQFVRDVEGQASYVTTAEI